MWFWAWCGVVATGRLTLKRRLLTPPVALAIVCAFSGALAEPRSPYDEPDATLTYSFSISGWLSSLSNNRLVQQLAQPEALSYNQVDMLWDIADQWTAYSLSGGHVQVNMPYNDQSINIYLLDHDYLVKTGHRSLPLCPCAYLPGTKTILCDDQALHRAVTYLDQYTKEAEEPKGKDRDHDAMIDSIRTIRSWHRRFMSEWIIAHEIGHAVLNHSADDLRISWRYQGTNIGLDAERQADDFYLRKMQHNSDDQFSAFMGLSQLMTHLYAEAIDNFAPTQSSSKRSRPFATSTPVEVSYAPQFHPPFLIRAVTLFHELISRYPNMIDNTGYNDRIAAQIHPKLANNEVIPDICNALPFDSQLPDLVDSLYQYVDIYTNMGNAVWTHDAIGRIRALSNSSPRRATIDAILLPLLEAKVVSKQTIPSYELSAFKAKIDMLPDDIRPLAQLEYDSVLANLEGDSPSKPSNLLDDGIENTNKLVELKLLDLENDHDRYDALANLLTMVPYGGVGSQSDNLDKRSKLLEQIINIDDIGGLRKEHLLSILEYQASGQLSSPKAEGDQAWLISVRAVDDLIDATKAFGYVGKEISLRDGQLRMIRKYFPSQHSVIINREEAIAHLQMTMLDSDSAIKHQRAAYEEISLFDRQHMSESDKMELDRWRANIQNGLGWMYVKSGQQIKAVDVLEQARESDESRRSLEDRCKKGDLDDQRLGSVYQNLGDAYLAEGLYEDALRFAIVSQNCREVLAAQASSHDQANSANPVRSKELLEAMKTRAFALHALGNEIEAREYAEKFVKGFAKILDDNVIPDEFLVQIVGGKEFALGAIVDIPRLLSDEKNARPEAHAVEDGDASTPPREK
jgi:tetratricopeptide (TPR) repeat protein